MALNAKRFRPYVQLIRLPNSITAIADVSAGMLLAGAAFADWRSWCWIAASSFCLYAGGVTLNDVCDHAEDGVNRPQRPIPSGKVSRTVAAMLATALLLVGIAAAMQCSVKAGVVAAGLLVSIVLYDATFKRAPFAPAIMGTCRALNLALGMFAVTTEHPFRMENAIPLFLMWLYVSSITYFARREADGGSKRQLIMGTVGVVAAVASVLWLPTFTGGGRMVFLVIVAGCVAYLAALGTRAVTEQTPARVQYAVGRFVLGIVVLDALFTWTACGPWLAGLVLLWLAPAVVLSRRFKIT